MSQAVSAIPKGGSARRRRRLGAPLGALGVLLAALVAPVSPAAALWPFAEAGSIDPDAPIRELAAELLSAAIRLPSVNPPGDEKPVAELYVQALRSAGIEARVIDTPSNGSEIGRAAAWGRLPGSGAKRPIVLASHLDVVPADPTEWAVQPFEGVAAGGFVVGRGALDSKGVGVVHLLTLVALKRSGVQLDRDVIFLATPDEETGGRQGAGWLVTQHKELLHDAEYLLTEGGGIRAGTGETPPIWGVSVTEKTPCWLELQAHGQPGHSSTAPPDGAVPRLVAALERVRRIEPDVRVVPEVQRMFAELAPLAPPDDREGFRNLAASLIEDPLFRGRFLSDRGRAALVRNTVAITVLEGAPRTNVAPARARAHLDVRLLPGDRCEDFADDVRVALGDPHLDVEILLSFTANASPAETELFDAIRRTALELEPEARVVPRVIAGFTDAHYFRDLGIVAYGFVPRWLPPHESRGIHGKNERISLENLERGVDAMVRILRELR